MNQNFLPPLYIIFYILLTIIGFLVVKRREVFHIYFWNVVWGKTYHIFLCTIHNIDRLNTIQENWNVLLKSRVGARLKEWDGELIINDRNIYYKLKIKTKHIDTMTSLVLTYSNS